MKELWLMAAPRADIVVDTTAAFDRKMAALRSHASQGTQAPGMEERIRGWAEANAAAAGLPAGALAESFQVVTAP